jgi:uncharacterized protein (TIGR02453 family)
MGKSFEGFYKETFDFLLAIGLNNYREYFQQTRGDFEKYVQEPLLLLAARLEPVVQKIDETLVTSPKRVISRIYRDTRFSSDKSPYRDHMWLGYKRDGEAVSEGCGYYFEITPFGWGYGMGMYGTQKERMDKLRDAMKAAPLTFSEAFEALTKDGGFTLNGEDYKRVPAGGEALPDTLKALYSKKSFYYEHSGKLDDTVYSPKIADAVEKGLLKLAPVYRMILKASL